MKPRWLVRGQDEAWEWVRLADNRAGTPDIGRGDSAHLAAVLKGEPVILVLAAQDVGLHEVHIAARTRAQLVAAAPYAIEELIVDDVDRLHFAVAASTDRQHATIALVKQDLLVKRIEALQEQGVIIAAVLPEMLTLPSLTPDWSMAADGERLVVRCGTSHGFGGEIPFVLALIRAHQAFPKALHVYGACDVALLEQLQELTGADIHHDSSPEAIAVMASHSDVDKSLDLLPSQYRDPHAGRNRNRYLQVAAACLALAAGIFYSYQMWQLDALEERVLAVRTAQHERFRDAFPNVKRIVNVNAQARNELRRLEAGGHGPVPFLDLLHALGSSYAAGRRALDLVALSYADGRINLTLDADSVSALEGFSERMVASAVVAEILSAETVEQGVRSRVRVSRP